MTGRQADADAQLLDYQRIDKVVVVGISAGAWSSMQFAILHPERCRALVLLVPANYLPARMSVQGGAVVRAMFNSDFVAWAALRLMPMMPGGMTRIMLGTDAAVVHAAETGEKARVQQVLDHLLPVSRRIAGMNFDIETAATHEPYPIRKIAGPVLAISTEDDWFGTASRAKYIVANAPDALCNITSFLQTVQQRRTPR
jgi:pimeloyl-ACP methyl ester carboxylesterase